MAIPVPESGNDFVRPLPPEGRLNAVCCDVHYLGLVTQKKYQSQDTEQVPMVLILWAVGDPAGNVYRNEEMGWPLTVGNRYRLSLATNAKLHKVIQRWCNGGKALSDQVVKALMADIERPLLGRTAELSVHYSDDGKYANIDNKGEWVEPLPQIGYTPMKVPKDYVRIANRPPKDEQGKQQPQRQADPLPQHVAGQRADDNAFAAAADDPFGGPAQPQRAPVTYENFQALPIEDDDDLPF